MQVNAYAEQTLNSPIGLTTNARGSFSSLFAWWGYWFCAWIGTTIAGGIFGLLLIGFGSLFNGEALSGVTIIEAIKGLFFGLLMGLMWAGWIGALVIPHIGIAWWMFRFNREPRHAGAIAGGLVGAICGIIFLPITAPMGWAGAFYACRAFTATEFGQQVSKHKTAQCRYSMKDLFLRMTVIAILLGFWVGVAQYNQSQSQAAQFQYIENWVRLSTQNKSGVEFCGNNRLSLRRCYIPRSRSLSKLAPDADTMQARLTPASSHSSPVRCSRSGETTTADSATEKLAVRF